jgi:hypothetical protein
MMQEAVRLARERRGGELRWVVHALMVGASPAIHWVRVLRTSRLAGARAKARGVLGLVRIRGYRCRRMLRLLAASGR